MSISKSKFDKIQLLMKREKPVSAFHDTHKGAKIDLYIFCTMESKGSTSGYEPVPHEYLVCYKNDKPEYLKSFTGKNIGESHKILEDVREGVRAEKTKEAEKKKAKTPNREGYPEDIGKMIDQIEQYKGGDKSPEKCRMYADLGRKLLPQVRPQEMEESGRIFIARVEGRITEDEWKQYVAELHRAGKIHSEKPETPKTKTKERPLPKDARNPTDLTLNSQAVTCYGKDLGPGRGRGYRIYCRKK